MNAGDPDDRDDPDGRPEDRLSHVDARGRARMVDVSSKPETDRTARARAVVELGEDLRRALFAGELEKGEALGVARIAGIQAAKETARLIPLCHPLALSSVEVEIAPSGAGAAEVVATVRCRGATGVEMEALTAAAVAALTIYDMCKAVSKGIRIGPVELLEKTGGKSGTWRRGAAEERA